MAPEQTPQVWNCTVEFHEDGFSRENVVINPNAIPGCTLKYGDLAKVAPFKSNVATYDFQAERPNGLEDEGAQAAAQVLHVKDDDSSTQTGSKSKKFTSKAGRYEDSHVQNMIDQAKSLVFFVKHATSEHLTKRTSLQISIHTSVKAFFGLTNRMPVVVIPAEREVCTADFVEVAFRDQYLARADMWQLAVTEMTEQSVYKGQQLLYMGTIKVTVRNIFVRGKKVISAYIAPSTVPIFRSESARYVFYIQMSQEMWDYDAEGTGEIMFNKVINGFLPDLFKRWQKLNVHHLVSIIMFTRLEYEQGVLRSTGSGDAVRYGPQVGNQPPEFRDYYKVVTTDMQSGDWVRILYDLRKEFKVFLRDTLILPGDEVYGRRPDTLAEVKDAPDVECTIAGRPTTATRGNVLEAINLASSQFAQDYIDRDLVRTGISLAIITAGTGVFEVDYNMLKLTTDTLVGNGIGIDVVSLSPMPLHSVPLFRYRTPQFASKLQKASLSGTLAENENTPRFQTSMLSASSPQNTMTGSVQEQQMRLFGLGANTSSKLETDWSFALPHWVDVSFWTGRSYEAGPNTRLTRTTRSGKSKPAFAATCRMHELQMMGLMENEMTDISIPFLRPQNRLQSSDSSQNKSAEDSFGPGSFSEAVARRGLKGKDPSPSLSPQKGSAEASGGVDTATRQELMSWMNLYDQNSIKPVLWTKILESQRSGSNESSTAEESSISQVIKGAAFGSPESTRTMATLATVPRESISPRKPMPFVMRPRGDSTASRDSIPVASNERPKLDKPSKLFLSSGDPPKRGKVPRQISFGPKGLATIKGTASISISSANVTSAKVEHKRQSSNASAKMSGMLGQQLRNTLQRKQSQQSIAKVNIKDDQSSPTRTAPSHPIAIKDPSTDSSSEDDQLQSATVKPGTALKLKDDGTLMHPMKKDQASREYQTTAVFKPGNDLMRTLSPLTAMSPWLTLLNPSNPKKENMTIASQFRRWQHVFPKAIPTSSIKWKSLCSPAALPLTSEYFPTAEELRDEYIESPYKISVMTEDETAETPTTREALLKEFVAARLANGFQMVIGKDAEAFTRAHRSTLLDAFDPRFPAKDGSTLLLSIGNNFHQLLCTDIGQIQVRRFLRKPMESVESEGLVDPSVTYQPRIRTILADTYEKREFIFRNPRSKYDWNAIDEYLAGGRQYDMSPDLRFWRARFVLVPVNPPKSLRGPLAPVAEVSDEETRLEGIQKLTQMWQRYRYIPPEERRFQASVQQRRKDPNPLAIDYQTRDPSAVVRAYANGPVDTLLHGELPAPLFAEADLYHTNDFDLQKLAQHLQTDPPKGITVVDRRWHWKLYHRCFRGDEFASWLLMNFKDMETRENAVKLGNELMKKGLFAHVQSKHHFRDGNYFYQISSEYRKAPYPESRTWFHRMTDRSVPSTPSLDGPRSSPFSEKSRSRPTTDDDSSTSSGDRTPKKARAKLELSRVLQYDVDHRKRSHRPEIINLHYDRIHNPDNCYHIRIDWMNVTAKLIEDAIVTWATSVERYGLRLVEVPIAEVSTITSAHPFRAPYKVTLAVPPPPLKSRQTYFDTTSFAPHAIDSNHNTGDRFQYQKALLRKFDFVLDLEAAVHFDQEDTGVEVTYSWGEPNYRYTQFVHKSGTILAQITDDGNFLLLANRLCVNRAAAAKDAGKFEKWEKHQVGRGGGVGAAGVAGMGTGVRPSPFASPLVRAVNDAPLAPSGIASSAGGGPMKRDNPVRAAVASTSTGITAEGLKDTFERFCSNEAELLAFYEVALKVSASPSPRNTPVLRHHHGGAGNPSGLGTLSASGGATSTRAGLEISDREIPALGLPPMLQPGHRAVSYAHPHPSAFGSSRDGGAAVAGGDSPRWGAAQGRRASQGP